MGERPPAPEWHAAVMSAPVEQRRIDVEGAAIELFCWGEIRRPAILLIHGPKWARRSGCLRRRGEAEIARVPGAMALRVARI